jgi:hypothetical protein
MMMKPTHDSLILVTGAAGTVGGIAATSPQCCSQRATRYAP